MRHPTKLYTYLVGNKELLKDKFKR
jgi:hypothetical protein